MSNFTTLSTHTMKEVQSSALTPEEAGVLLALRVLIIILILTLNAMVLIVYARSTRIRAVPHNVFIIALAITDFMTGIWSLPSSTFKNIVPLFFDPDDPIPWYYEHKGLCLAGLFSAEQPPILTGGTLLLIAIDRFVASLWPLKYYELMTRIRAAIITCLTWVIVSIPLYAGIAYANHQTYDMYSICLPQYQYPAGLYWVTMLMYGPIPLFFCYILYVCIIVKMYSGTVHVENQKRITKMMAVVLTVYTVCVLPFMAAVLGYNPVYTKARVIAILCTKMLFSMNSFANPIIYNFTNKTFRHEFARIICRSRKVDKNSSEVDGNENTTKTMQETKNKDEAKEQYM